MAEISCRYDLDEALCIVAVDAGWSRFAAENDAPELLPPAPIGRPVLSYVTDRTTAALYERLFQRVRSRRVPARIPIRCDGPSLRRFLDLEIAPLAAGIRVTSIVTRTEPWLAAAPDRSDGAPRDPVRMCTFCKRVAAGDQWLEVDAFVSTRRVFESPAPGPLTHGVCDDCVRLVESQIE